MTTLAASTSGLFLGDDDSGERPEDSLLGRSAAAIAHAVTGGPGDSEGAAPAWAWVATWAATSAGAGLLGYAVGLVVCG